MPFVTLRDESRRHRQGNFYVPQFEVKIEGVGLPRDVLRDVVQVTYHDNIKEIDGFELTVNNWDATSHAFKYVGAETTASLQGDTAESRRYRLFEPCNREFEVYMGYGGELRLMVRGSCTTMEPNFPSSGGPTLAVRGLNVLHKLRRKRYTHTWPNKTDSQLKTDSQIAEDIATLKDQETHKKRFPLPIVTNATAKALEKPLEYVAQQNQYDIDFLLTRARQRGYVVYVLERDPHGKGVERQQRLYFGPSQTPRVPALRAVTFVLQWGVSLIDFKPTLTTANQVKSVTVKGWNRATKQAIQEQVYFTNARLDLNRDLMSILEKCEPREEMVVNEPSFTPAQAKERALALLTERLKEMMKASGTCIGLPDLRAGQEVVITGVGARFSGTYFITDTTHTINDQGYITKFNARREQHSKGSKP